MSRVLVTGASGFVGAHALAPLLQAGHEVHAVSTRVRNGPPGVSWRAADLLDPVAAERLLLEIEPERLLHLAWYAEHGRFWTSPENVRWVEATLRLLRAFAAIGGTRAVLAGTCAEYDWSHPVLSESATPLAPSTLYGTCKHATRLVAEAFAREAGLELAWGRIFFLYGPGEAPGRLVPAIASALLRGEDAATTSGTQIRDFMHVEDVAAAFAALIDSSVQGPINIASGEGVSVRALAEMIAAETGRLELLRVGALADRPGEPPRLVAETLRLREEVGFVPRWSLRDGVANTLEWWRRELAGVAVDG